MIEYDDWVERLPDDARSKFEQMSERITNLMEQLVAERAARERVEQEREASYCRESVAVERMRVAESRWEQEREDRGATDNLLAERDQQLAALRKAACPQSSGDSGDPHEPVAFTCLICDASAETRETIQHEYYCALIAPLAADPPKPHTLCARCAAPLQTLLRGNFCPPCNAIVEAERAGAEQPDAVGAVE